MKRFILVLLALMLMASAAAADVQTPAFSYHETDRPLLTSAMLPMDDGSLLFYGGLANDDTPVENYGPCDGYAAMVGPDGITRWDMRLGDAGGRNRIFPRGVLPDGRILLCLYGYGADYMTLGNQHLIVRADKGYVEETLPSFELARSIPPLTLTLMPDGYAGGGYRPADDMYMQEQNEHPGFSHFDGRTIVRMDYDLNKLWQLKLSQFEGADFTIAALAGGDTLLMGIVDDDGGRAMHNALLRVDPEGKVRWTYEDAPQSYVYGIHGVVEDAEGNLIFLADYWHDDGEKTEEMPRMALYCMSADGEVLWQRPVDTGFATGDADVVYVYSLMAFGDGYLAAANDGISGGFVYMDKDGEILQRMAVDVPEGQSLIGLSVTASPNGRHAYGYGRFARPVEGDEPGVFTHVPEVFFYFPLAVEDFA